MRLTFLGTGTSFGIPQIGCGCAVCASTDPRDKRNRTSAVVRGCCGTGEEEEAAAASRGRNEAKTRAGRIVSRYSRAVPRT